MTGQRWANTFHHLGSYILSEHSSYNYNIIKNDIALSLGMIEPIDCKVSKSSKSPFELLSFSLLTLGIVVCIRKIIIVIIYIYILILFSIHFFHKIAKNLKDICQLSFGEGNLVYTLEVNSKKLDDLEKNKSVIEIFEDNENNNFFIDLHLIVKKSFKI